MYNISRRNEARMYAHNFDSLPWRARPFVSLALASIIASFLVPSVTHSMWDASYNTSGWNDLLVEWRLLYKKMFAG